MIPPDLLSAIQAGGVAVIPFLAVMWWRAEARANSERDKNESLAREAVTAVVKIEATMATMISLLTSAGRGTP